MQLLALDMDNQSGKILLVQIRHDEVTRKHEFECVIKVSELSAEDFIVHDLISEPLGEEMPESVCAIIVGGSGEHSGYQDFPNRSSLSRLLRGAFERGIPVLGLCFGAQYLADEFGGKCANDQQCEEVGSFEIFSTPEAADDELFAEMPERYYATEGHKCYIQSPPSGSRVLAKSGRCPVQAFQMPQGNVYGIQFHPELDKDGLIWRMEQYRSFYVESGEEFDCVTKNAKDTPEAVSLLKRWVKLFVR